MAALLAYDYCLTLSREIETVWKGNRSSSKYLNFFWYHQSSTDWRLICFIVFYLYLIVNLPKPVWFESQRMFGLSESIEPVLPHGVLYDYTFRCVIVDRDVIVTDVEAWRWISLFFPTLDTRGKYRPGPYRRLLKSILTGRFRIYLGVGLVCCSCPIHLHTFWRRQTMKLQPVCDCEVVRDPTGRDTRRKRAGPQVSKNFLVTSFHLNACLCLI